GHLLQRCEVVAVATDLQHRVGVGRQRGRRACADGQGEKSGEGKDERSHRITSSWVSTLKGVLEARTVTESPPEQTGFLVTQRACEQYCGKQSAAPGNLRRHRCT